MEEEMLMLRHPRSKPPDPQLPVNRQKERGLVTRKRAGALYGKGTRYWKSPRTGTARRDFATDCLELVKHANLPNAQWRDIFCTKDTHPGHVPPQDEYELREINEASQGGFGGADGADGEAEEAEGESEGEAEEADGADGGFDDGDDDGLRSDERVLDDGMRGIDIDS